jgi:hypothetical protein
MQRAANPVPGCKTRCQRFETAIASVVFPPQNSSTLLRMNRLTLALVLVVLLCGFDTVVAQEYFSESTVNRSSTFTSPDPLIKQAVETGPSSNPQSPGSDAEKQKEDEKKLAELKKKVASAHKPVFYDNDFSYLCDDSYNDFQLGDNLKKRCLPGGGNYDIGGQYRARAHFEQNIRGLGLTGVDDQFLLHRTRVYGDFRFTPNIRLYAEMLDAESSFEDFPSRSIEVNRGDMLNLFFDARLLNGCNGSLTARVGRQELLFGAQRAVSPLDWANTRRTFDGARLMWKEKDLAIDGFWSQPVTVDDHSFDAPDRDQEFMGVYSSYGGRKDQTVDAYFLRYLNGRGANDFEFNTIGARWQGSQCDFLWDFEAAFQFGDNTDGSNHVAGMTTLGLGRKFSDR